VTQETNNQPTAAELRMRAAELERLETEDCMRALIHLANQMGFAIGAIPAMTRVEAGWMLTAQWGVSKLQ